MAVAVISLGGAVQTSITFLGLYPGADLIGAFTLGLIPALGFIVVYSITTAAFPRAGGDYVWVSRISGPTLGFVFSWLLQFGFLFAICGLQAYYVAWIGVPSALTGMGIIMNAPYLTQWSLAITSSTALTFLVELIFLVIGGVIVILGPRTYQRAMRGLYVYGMIGMIVWVGLLLSSTKAGFIQAFNSATAGTTSYQAILNSATSQGLMTSGTNIGATILAAFTIGWTAWTGFNYAVYAGGEIKNVTKSVPLALTAGLISSWIILVGVFILCINVFGGDFMAAVSALSVVGKLPLSVGPSMTFFISMLTTNPLLVFITTSNVIVWWFIIIPPLYLAGSRVLFAWSYDRVVPAQLANVDERFHSPMFAVVICVVVNAIWAYFLSYTVYGGFITTGFINAIGWAVPGFVAAVFPFTKKDLYKRTVGALPSAFSRKIAGVPILTIGGLVQGFSMVIYAFAAVSPTTTYLSLSPTFWFDVVQVLVLSVVGAGYIAFIRNYRKKQGMDMSLVFKEIPPE